MKTYTVISKKSNPEFYNSLDYGTTDVLRLLSQVAGLTSTIIFTDGMYDKVVTHASVRHAYAFNAHVCPVAKAFLLAGVWYADEKAVSPLLVAMNVMMTKEEA